MTTKSERPGHLQIVKAVEGQGTQRHVQHTLFPMPTRHSLCVVNVPLVGPFDLLEFIRSVSPSHVFDLRVIPRFDLHRLTRRKALDAFLSRGIQYHVSALFDKWWSDATVTSGKAAQVVSRVLLSSNPHHGYGPIVVLVDSPQDMMAAADALPRQLPAHPEGAWMVTIVSS